MIHHSFLINPRIAYYEKLYTFVRYAFDLLPEYLLTYTLKLKVMFHKTPFILYSVKLKNKNKLILLFNSPQWFEIYFCSSLMFHQSINKLNLGSPPQKIINLYFCQKVRCSIIVFYLCLRELGSNF